MFQKELNAVYYIIFWFVWPKALNLMNKFLLQKSQ
jgi:hypothetical protein